MILSLDKVTVLVTGASGFIGSHLSRRLVDEGADVHILVRSSSNLSRINDLNNKVVLHFADIEDFSTVVRVVRNVKPQKVFHLAARVDVSRSLDTLDKLIAPNIIGTINLLRASAETGIDCFINTGTCEEYGDNPTPFREEQIPNPVSPYSASKISTTMYSQMLYKTIGLPVITLRPFLTYGPWQECNMLIPSLITKIINEEPFEMTDGKQTREFNYVSDIVEGFIKASTSPLAIGKVINIGNGVEFRVRDVVQKIIQLMKSRLKPKFGALQHRPGETWHFYCDNTKAKKILGWEPKVTLDDGLKITIDWYQKHRGWETQT